MKKIYISAVLVSFFIILPSCGRIVDWGMGNFYQGKDIASMTDQVTPFIRSITIYDQLETKAIFDVLWLSDEVRTAYSNLHVLRQGKNEEKFHAILRRQLEENNHYITFYVLSTHEVRLGVPESQWSFFLRLNDHEYHPYEIREIDLPYEYQMFFGKRWSRFKVPYIMRFKPMSDDDSKILTDAIDQIKLVARSAQKEHVFIWQAHEDE